MIDAGFVTPDHFFPIAGTLIEDRPHRISNSRIVKHDQPVTVPKPKGPGLDVAAFERGHQQPDAAGFQEHRVRRFHAGIRRQSAPGSQQKFSYVVAFNLAKRVYGRCFHLRRLMRVHQLLEQALVWLGSGERQEADGVGPEVGICLVIAHGT